MRFVSFEVNRRNPNNFEKIEKVQHTINIDHIELIITSIDLIVIGMNSGVQIRASAEDGVNVRALRAHIEAAAESVASADVNAERKTAFKPI